jgi:hypothetical protein
MKFQENRLSSRKLLKIQIARFNYNISIKIGENKTRKKEPLEGHGEHKLGRRFIVLFL